MIKKTLSMAARQYPEELINAQCEDIQRIAFNIELVVSRKGTDISICDIGGGIGLFSVGCAKLGMHTALVDDFSDSVNARFPEITKSVHEACGINVVSVDVVSTPPDFEPESFDAVTTFDSMEHWHHSPKPLFGKIMSWLKPGGLFIIGVPNCVNLRKRVTIPFGVGKWSSMRDWYEEPVFRQHVREPDTQDLRYIAKDLKLENVEILGRNWLGYVSRYPLVRALTPIFDVPLRAMPSLCADIYLLGTKPVS